MKHTCPVGICPEHGTCSDCGADPEELSARLDSDKPTKQGHDCHCVTDGNKMRIAWGICCARITVGAALMAEEDWHDDVPWGRESDCTCADKQRRRRKIRAS